MAATLRATADDQAVVASAEEVGLAAAGTEGARCRLHERRAEMWVALPVAARAAPATALVVARADASPVHRTWCGRQHLPHRGLSLLDLQGRLRGPSAASRAASLLGPSLGLHRR